VRARRLEAGLTVNEFAQRAGLSPRFVNQLESGHGNISIARLVDVAAALGRAVPELVPPADDDGSLRAEIWRWLSQCRDEELHELRRWISERTGHTGPCFIALVGLRGAGKSTVGARLAKRLKLPFVEVDHRIEHLAGMSLEEIFSLHGEDYYRRLEREALTKLFAESGGCVLATGGSLVTDAQSWGLVKQRCLTIWLRATPREHMTRVMRQGDFRPMQGPAAMAELKALLKRREPLYAECQLIVKTMGKSPAMVLEEIIKLLPIV
jgi:XRE family aerobic/anaerobic benzoate catabolism transcriptional regulator